MMIEQSYISELAIPPGEYLEEVLEDLEISQVELSRRMGRPAQAINEIIKGEKAITPETALQLEKVVGVPAEIWSGLEAEYRLILAKHIEQEKTKKEQHLVSLYPYLEMRKLDLVENTRDIIKKVNELKRFFGVSSLLNVENVKEYSPAFRQTVNDNISKEAIAAWLRTGHLKALKLNVSTFNKKALRSVIPKIRTLTNEHEPNKLLSSLQDLLSLCGIALVVIPHYPKTFVTGATFWYGKNKPVIMMSLRGSWGDIFWFSLMHEIAHILLHDKRITFLECSKGDTEHQKQEGEADIFAKETLIPKTHYENFINQNDFSHAAIKDFASLIDIHAGIITGRLQHDKYLPHTCHHHRVRYKWQ
jgi:HTH-type transcriptional regulator/antitoxin HigA